MSSNKVTTVSLSDAIDGLAAKIERNHPGIKTIAEYREQQEETAEQLHDVLRGFAGLLDSVQEPEDPIAVTLVRYATMEADRVEEVGIFEDDPVLGLLDALYTAVEERTASIPLLPN